MIRRNKLGVDTSGMDVEVCCVRGEEWLVQVPYATVNAIAEESRMCRCVGGLGAWDAKTRVGLGDGHRKTR